VQNEKIERKIRSYISRAEDQLRYFFILMLGLNQSRLCRLRG